MSSILGRNYFSDFESPSRPNLSHEALAQTDLWYGGRCCLKNFKMATMVAIGDIGNRTILAILNSPNLKIFKLYLLPNRKSVWAERWWEALGQHGDSELLKSFRSNIQDGHYGNHLEILQTTSPKL